MAGKFIVLEGIEGAGKSTVVQYIDQLLKQNSIPFILTREPGGTPVAENIRKVLLTPTEEEICADTELLLMFASRAQHISHVIKPALSAHKWVISDRFTDATYAYQGGGRGMSAERISQIEKWVQGDLQPDLIIVLDVPAEIGMKRVIKRADKKDRFEQEQLAFFERARQVYLQRAKRAPNRYVVVDSARSIDKVCAQVREILLP